MANISHSLKKALQADFSTGSKPDYYLIAALLLVISIPLGYAVSNIALGIFVAASLIQFNKKNINSGIALLLPTVLFSIMLLSLTWSLNFQQSFKAISKNLPFLLIPLCFIMKPFSSRQVKTLLKYYSGAMVMYALSYIIRAIIRYLLSGNADVFFYHELTTKDVNAIHVSLYMGVALFYFITASTAKLKIRYIAIFILSATILLLSSKSLIITTFVLVGVYFLFYSDYKANVKITVMAALFFGIVLSLIMLPKIRERFTIETATMFTDNTINRSIGSKNAKVYNVTLHEALGQQKFRHNDYFPGVALRAFQARIFFEMMREDNAWFTGYGVNASQDKIREKASKYNLYPAYGEFNFHNQYIQNFAELGITGLLILLAMLGLNLKKALQNKDFVHISLAILLITLFLTESLLSRQRGIIFFIMFYCLLNTYHGNWRTELKEI